MSFRPRRWLLGAVGVGAAMVATACAGSPFSVGTPTATRGGIHTIKHVVVIMQENRSFDSYFGTYPGANGLPAKNGHFTVCNPDPSGGQCIAPYHDSADVNGGGPHGASSFVADVNGGKLDGFQASAEKGNRGCGNNNNPACTDSTTRAGRDGLPRRARDPQLLGLRAELRPPGCHVRAE